MAIEAPLRQPMSHSQSARKSHFRALCDSMQCYAQPYSSSISSLQSHELRCDQCEKQDCARCDGLPSGIPSETMSSQTLQGVLPLFTKRLSSSRLLVQAFVLFLAISIMFDNQTPGMEGSIIPFGVRAGAVARSKRQRKTLGELVKRQQTTDTDVCNRWSGQSALVNGTIYYYGGHTTTQQGQTSNTWTNDFLTIDVTSSWQISSPSIKGLPQPSGPPSVSNGYLWSSYDSLYLYGGEFSDTPIQEPTTFSLWEYKISSSSWVEHQNPQTSAGNNSDNGNQAVERVAEGAGISVPSLGRGWYFAGHQDSFTTPGWSNQIFRVYLKSLLEYTFPGYSNNGVESLSGGKTASSDGVWRNLTQGGIQDTNAFPNRADSALVYVPGFGANGILVSMGGGTNISFTQMNIIDVYDIATSTWYKQATSGTYPTLRVNPCAVAASAPDGTSTNIYMYGGQNLIPYLNQTQFSDMWILTIPSFTWIQVDTTGQSVPPARVGHTCNIWDGQIVVIGGYNTELAGGCDTGFYVFSATNLTWQNSFNSLSGGNKNNTQNLQTSQLKDLTALSGSYEYEVPNAVQSVIGGKPYGGATITAPAQSATAGPLATGKPVTYTVTGANGAIVTETGIPGSSASGGNSGPNIGAIVAGVVAGCFAILAGYLGFCAWVYRRQLALYKNHVAMTQRAAAGNPGEKSAFLTSTEGSSLARGQSSTDQSSGQPRSSNNNAVPPLPPGLGGPPVGGNSTANSSTEDLIGEPSFVGVLLNPRRSLRVVNRD